MPTLSKPVLTITLISGTPKAKVTVAGTLTLTAQEVAIINTNLVTTELSCVLWGEDDEPDSDDKLYTFTSKFPTVSTPYTFTKTLANKSTLDEDDAFLQGKDDIFARVTFRFKSSVITPAAPKSKNSNTIHASF